MSVTLQTESAEATVALGRRLSRQLKPGDVVLLHGDLGSGKTTLAQGMLAGLGVTSPVPSPTFTLINEYDGVTAVGESVRLYHLDLYRLASDPDLDSIGLDDYLARRMASPSSSGPSARSPASTERISSSKLLRRATNAETFACHHFRPRVSASRG